MIDHQPLETEVYVRQAEKALRRQPHLSNRDFRIQGAAGRLRLSGEVCSFYEKQIAQEALRQFDRNAEIENCLEVAW